MSPISFGVIESLPQAKKRAGFIIIIYSEKLFLSVSIFSYLSLVEIVSIEMRKINIGLIGFGRMGEQYLEAMLKSGRWEVSYICDKSPVAREAALEIFPDAK